jgi:hypothetical protein
MLQMNNEPTPARMLVSFGSSKASCCPSIGSLTVDASVANSSEAASTVVAKNHNNALTSASSAATMRVQNLAMSKVFHSPPAVAAANSNPAAREKSTTTTTTTHALESGGENAPPLRNRVQSMGMGQRQQPPPARKGGDVAIPPPARRVRSTDFAKPSEAADIFCQMKGLSFRNAPPDVNARWFAALKKTKGAAAGHAATRPNSSFASAETSGEFVISPRKQPEQQVFPVTPTFKTAKPKNGMVASEAPVVRSESRPVNNSKAANAKSKVGAAKLAIQASRSSSNFNEKVFAKTSRKVEQVPAVSVPSKKCEIVLSGNTTTKPSKDRSFLPAPLHQTDGAGVEFVLWDMDTDERDNCSATAATMTTNASTTLHNDQSPSTAATPETTLLSSREDLLLLSRPLCHVESSGMYERYAAAPERSRGSLYHNESLGESNRDSDFDGSGVLEDDLDGLALSEQENEMLMLALKRSLHDMSHHQRSMEYQ